MIVDTEELVSTQEIATLADVSKQAVANWVARHDTFPRPVATFGNGKFKLFLLSDVIEWLSARQSVVRTNLLPKHSEDDTVWV